MKFWTPERPGEMIACSLEKKKAKPTLLRGWQVINMRVVLCFRFLGDLDVEVFSFPVLMQGGELRLAVSSHGCCIADI